MAKVICPAPGCQITVMEINSGCTSSLEVRYFFMPLYGPQEWFPFVPRTQAPLPISGDEHG